MPLRQGDWAVIIASCMLATAISSTWKMSKTIYQRMDPSSDPCSTPAAILMCFLPIPRWASNLIYPTIQGCPRIPFLPARTVSFTTSIAWIVNLFVLKSNWLSASPPFFTTSSINRVLIIPTPLLQFCILLKNVVVLVNSLTSSESIFR